ncbi:unnamed protein product [Larinioides sclopetarius]|uniref:Uncharacterized protein n=1 Tax=Larinioides sclopetarius TaxID=280406 RepID=A0AAV1ZK27_9ARAC
MLKLRVTCVQLLVIKIQAFDYGKRSCWRLGTSS